MYPIPTNQKISFVIYTVSWLPPLKNLYITQHAMMSQNQWVGMKNEVHGYSFSGVVIDTFVS